MRAHIISESLILTVRDLFLTIYLVAVVVEDDEYTSSLNIILTFVVVQVLVELGLVGLDVLEVIDTFQF